MQDAGEIQDLGIEFQTTRVADEGPKQNVASRAIFESTSAIPATVLGRCVVGFFTRSIFLCESCDDIVLLLPVKPSSAATKVWTNLRRSIIN